MISFLRVKIVSHLSEKRIIKSSQELFELKSNRKLDEKNENDNIILLGLNKAIANQNEIHEIIIMKKTRVKIEELKDIIVSRAEILAEIQLHLNENEKHIFDEDMESILININLINDVMIEIQKEDDPVSVGRKWVETWASRYNVTMFFQFVKDYFLSFWE